MSKKIQDNNRLYNLLCPLVKFATRCHYNEFVVRGTENLPTDGSYIIAPCHQQALMEPLAVLYFSPKPPVFLARADIFRKPTLRAILTFLRIMPVYRIRDGQDQLGRNQEVFDRCRDVLVDGYPLCLMAEGRHNNCHRLLPLRKGMFRIAGEAQMALGNRPLYIVPTGIDFDDYERPYSNVVVNIGKPIPVQPFMETYRNNEPVALNQMRDALTEALLPLMHDIRDEEHYDEIMELCHRLNREMRQREGLKNNAWNRFLMRQKITSMLQDSETSRLKDLKNSRPKVAEHWSIAGTLLALLVIAGLLATILLLPQARWALLFLIVCYPLPFIPTHLIVKKKVADPQFRSSFNFGVRLAVSILYAIAIVIVMACGTGNWFLSHIAPLTGVSLHLTSLLTALLAMAWIHVAARLTAPVVNCLRNTLNSCRYWLLHLAGRQ